MTKEQKAQEIQDLTDKLSSVKNLYFTDIAGLDAVQRGLHPRFAWCARFGGSDQRPCRRSDRRRGRRARRVRGPAARRRLPHEGEGDAGDAEIQDCGADR